MLERHAKELESDITSTQTSTDPTTPIPNNDNSDTPTNTIKDAPKPQLTTKEKALAKKAKKREKEREKERARVEAIEEENSKAGPSARELEYNCIMELYLKPRKLNIKDIMADGNCLYRAIAHQMELRGKHNEDGSTMSYEQIRSLCADMLMKRRSEYEPFADLSDNHVSSFDDYIDRVRNSSEWGGHLELRALAAALQMTIVIYSAQSSPLHIRDATSENSEETGEICLSFHKSYYALGEHYNSVISCQ